MMYSIQFCIQCWKGLLKQICLERNMQWVRRIYSLQSRHYVIILLRFVAKCKPVCGATGNPVSVILKNSILPFSLYYRNFVKLIVFIIFSWGITQRLSVIRFCTVTILTCQCPLFSKYSYLLFIILMPFVYHFEMRYKKIFILTLH